MQNLKPQRSPGMRKEKLDCLIVRLLDCSGFWVPGLCPPLSKVEGAPWAESKGIAHHRGAESTEEEVEVERVEIVTKNLNNYSFDNFALLLPYYLIFSEYHSDIIVFLLKHQMNRAMTKILTHTCG